MDEGLKAKSKEFDRVMQTLVDSTRQELDDVTRRIVELQTILQDKEMHTDRSENASFQIARDELDIKTAISARLHKRIDAFSAATGNYNPTDIVTLGSTVELKVITINDKPPVNIQKTSFTFKLVEHDLAKAALGLVAIDSKVGAALLHKVVGQSFDTKTPKGKIQYRIERLY